MNRDERTPPCTPDRTRGGIPPDPAPARQTRVLPSEELFAGAREIAIEHNGRRYQLRITQLGKLILTA